MASICLIFHTVFYGANTFSAQTHKSVWWIHYKLLKMCVLLWIQLQNKESGISAFPILPKRHPFSVLSTLIQILQT